MNLTMEEFCDRIDRSHVFSAMIKRHRDGGEGFCTCCSQPWPCDLARLAALAGVKR